MPSSQVPSVRIARLDVDRNELPRGFAHSGPPALYLLRAHSRYDDAELGPAPLKYTAGEWAVAPLRRFVARNARVRFDGAQAGEPPAGPGAAPPGSRP